MRLRLNTTLRAALIAAFTAASAYAYTSQTTTYEGTVYNGDIWTWNNASGKNVSSGDSKYTSYTDPQVQYAGNDKVTGGPAAFWQMIQFGSDNGYVGQTLRFDGASNNVNLVTDYQNHVYVGGIITTAGNTGTYTFGRADTNIKIAGTNDVNMSIASNFTLQASKDNRGISIEKGGTWNVAENKILTLTGGQGITLSAGQTVTLSGAGTTNFNGPATLNGNIVVGANSTFGVTGATTLGATITNAGRVNFGDTVSVEDFSGFKGTVEYSDSGNGFVMAGKYTLVEGAGTVTGLTQISHGGSTLAVNQTDYTVSVNDADYTAYYLNTANATVDVDDAAAVAEREGQTLTTVYAKNTGGIVKVDSAQSLATLSVDSGADATISGEGTLTLTTLNNAGTLKVATGLTMANAENFTSSDTPAIQVKNGGVFTFVSNSKVDGAQIGSGAGTGEQTNASFSKLFKGQVVSTEAGGKVVLKGNVIVCDTTTGKAGATMTSGVSELEIQGGFQINTYAVNPGTTWALSNNTLRATDYLWLTNHQFLTVAGGSVETGELRLGHDANSAGGSYLAKLTATSDSNIVLGSIALYGGHNEVNISNSTLAFTKTDGNVLGQAKTAPTAAADLNKVVLNDTTLNAIDNSWTLQTIDSTTVSLTGANTVNAAAGQTATLSVNSIEGTLTKAGEGAFSLIGTTAGTAIDKAIALDKGTLSMTGNFSIDGMEVSDEVITWDTPEGIEAGSGFKKVSGRIVVVNKAADTTLNVNATVTRDSKEVTLENTGIVTLDGTADYTTLWVNGTSSVSYNVAQTYAGATTVETVRLAHDGATIDMDKADASVALVLSEGVSGTVNATAATTISAVSGWSGNKLTIAGTDVVSMAGQTLDSNKTLQVDGKVSTGALLVNGATLLVSEGGELNVSGNLSPVHGTVEIDGLVNISSELDLSKGKTSDVNLLIGSTGKVTANGMWMHSASAITLVEEGELAIGGLSIAGKEGNGAVNYTGAVNTDEAYGTNKEKYKITNATVTSTGNNVTLGNTLVDTDVVVANGSRLTLNTDATNVTVGNGGTFYLNEGKNVTNLTVEDGGTIAGGVDATAAKIAAEGTATFTQGIENGGVTFGWEEGSTKVTNKGETAAVYGGVADETMRVTTDVLTAASESAVTVKNEVQTSAIVNYAEGPLTLTNVVTEDLQSIAASAGDVTLQNVGTDPIALANLLIGSGTTVAVYQGADIAPNNEGTITVTESLMAGGGTLLADLTLYGGSTLDVDGGHVAGGTMNALTLGSTLTFDLEQGGLVNLDQDTIDALAGLNEGERLDLIVAADQTKLKYGDSYEGVSYDTLFSTTGLTGPYTVYANEGSFGLLRGSQVPEPTTGTLSLLALAALAARRRRK